MGNYFSKSSDLKRTININIPKLLNEKQLAEKYLLLIVRLLNEFGYIKSEDVVTDVSGQWEIRIKKID